MALSKETVKYVADLSRIELDPQELEKLSLQLQTILGFIDLLNQADIEGIEPTSHILPLNNILRSDQIKESLTIERALANAPQKKDNFFVVPRVIE